MSGDSVPSAARPTSGVVVADLDDPFVRRALRVSMHLRRYFPFYVFSLLWALMVAVVPTTRGVEADRDTPTAVEQADVGAKLRGSESSLVTKPADGSVAVTNEDRPAEAAAERGGDTTVAEVDPARSPQLAQELGGMTRDGRECAPGVRQLPLSHYATQCANNFDGDNGGETYRGVTADTIRIVRRSFPETANSQASEQLQEEAGFASDDVAETVRDVFINYFNETYELYGRKVEWVDYESQNGNSTEEAQSRGREGACADATQIVEELKAFAVYSSSGPFGSCAAERELPVLHAGAYFPEKYYEQHHPYLWHVAMECERIAHHVHEYIGKRLHNRPARWAGDPVMQQQTRRFGTYIPDNDEYQHCVQIWERVLEERYGATTASRYNYQLDLSRFPDQAAQAIVQFKAAGVTTITNACDPYSTVFLTQAADSQDYHPEWFIIGVALQDTDNLARLYSQNQVDGHLFGMSQLGATEKLIGPDSEPGRLYHHITGEEIPPGTSGSYFGLVHTYNLLQAAGPNLTPEAMAAGAPLIPPGGAPDFAAGYWSFQDGPAGDPGGGDHTTIDDSREIYWDGNATGPDGDRGTYLETYGGRRFRNGEWPAEEPAVYPDR